MDCPKLYPVEWYLSHCKSLARELGVPNDVDVSLVHIARAPAWFFSDYSDGAAMGRLARGV